MVCPGSGWAADAGIVTGYGGSFIPDGNLTREQLAVMLYRYAGSPETAGSLAQFSDVAAVSSYAEEALRWAVEHGILAGTDNAVLDPQGEATRAEVAVVLMRFCAAEHGLAAIETSNKLAL